MSCGKYSNQVFFDKMAPIWDNVTEVWPDKIRYIIDKAELHPGARVLDVGTGTGVLIPYIEDVIGNEGHIDAADISNEMLKMAKSKFCGFDNIDYLNIDVENDYVKSQYDCIMMYCMFPHLERPLETLDWLVKVNLKPGGHLVIAFPEAKEAINGIHTHKDGSVHSDSLPDSETFCRQLQILGLNVDFSEDSADYYILRIRH